MSKFHSLATFTCMQITHAKLFSGVGVVLSLLAGCSDNGLQTVPVHGRINTASGQAPSECYVYFLPSALAEGTPSRPSVARVADDGSYSVKAFKDSDGLLPGTYKSRVTYSEPRPGVNPNAENAGIMRQVDVGEVVVDANADDIEHNIELPAKS